MRGAGSFSTRSRRIRRLAGAFLLSLFIVANPAYSCPIHCLLHHEHDGDHDGSRGGPAMMDGMCHDSGPAFTAPGPPGDRDLSPNVPAAVRTDAPPPPPPDVRDVAHDAPPVSTPSRAPATPPPRT